MSNSLHIPAFSKAAIDGKTTGTTKIGTTENGTQRFIPISVLVEVTNASALLGVPTLSVGTNSATYNNILIATALTGVSLTNHMMLVNLPTTIISSVAVNTDIFVNITVGATATTCTLRVDLLGYYL